MKKKNINHICKIVLILFFYMLGLLTSCILHYEFQYPKNLTDLVMEVGGFLSITVVIFYINDLLFNFFGLDIIGKIKRFFQKLFVFAKDA